MMTFLPYGPSPQGLSAPHHSHCLYLCGVSDGTSSWLTLYSRISSSFSRVTITFTSCLSTLTLCTSPLKPSSVVTRSPIFGSLLLSHSYVSSSFFRQHISRPQTPLIFVGFKDKFCSFAILIDTGANSDKMYDSRGFCRRYRYRP